MKKKKIFHNEWSLLLLGIITKWSNDVFYLNIEWTIVCLSQILELLLTVGLIVSADYLTDN